MHWQIKDDGPCLSLTAHTLGNGEQLGGQCIYLSIQAKCSAVIILQNKCPRLKTGLDEGH